MPIDPSDLNALADDRFRQGEGGTALARRVQEDPVSALQLIGSTSLARGQSAKALDNIIGAIGDDAKAKDLVAEHVTAEVQAEILVAWGDRVSSLAQIADPETLIQAIFRMSHEEGHLDLAVACATVRGLAMQIHDRSDWDEVLDLELSSDFTLRDLLVIAVAAEVDPVDLDPKDAGDDDEDDETSSQGARPADAWVNVGLNPDEAEERLEELEQMSPDIWREVTDTALFSARLALSKKREELGLPADATRGSAHDV